MYIWIPQILNDTSNSQRVFWLLQDGGGGDSGGKHGVRHARAASPSRAHFLGTRIDLRVRAHTDESIHAHIHVYMHAHTYARTHVSSQLSYHSLVRTLSRYTHEFASLHAPMQVYMHTQINPSTLAHTHTHIPTYTHVIQKSTQKSPVYTQKSHIYTLERVLYTLKRAPYTLKRDLHTIKRALYTLSTHMSSHLTCSSFMFTLSGWVRASIIAGFIYTCTYAHVPMYPHVIAHMSEDYPGGLY